MLAWLCLVRAENDLHVVQLMPLPPHHLFIKIQNVLTFLVPAYPGYLGKEAVKLMSVCLLFLVEGEVP